MGLAPRCLKFCSILSLCGGERIDPNSQVLIAFSKLWILPFGSFFFFALKPKNGKIIGQKDEEEKTC